MTMTQQPPATAGNSIEVLYGRDRLALELPADAEPVVLGKPVVDKITDPTTAVADALTAPVGCPPLAELARGRSSACILICDITRPVPNRLFLRPLVDALTGAGMDLSRITIVVATGLHRVGSRAELLELCGDEWIVDNVRVVWHDARDEEMLVDLGRTPDRGVETSGTEVWINKHFAEADLRIATGLVEPHFMAGWSGGRKVVAPGVAGHRTIRTFHSARFMEHPDARQCNLDGNPLHTEQLAIVAKVGEVYALNTVIDEDRDLNFVNFGEVVASHLAAVDFVADIAKVSTGRRFSTVVTSSAGYPLDKTYYQTVKGMVTPMGILEPGGTVIMVSECSEGFGSPEFREASKRLVDLGTDGFLDSLLVKEFADVDEWQTEMQLKPMRQGTVLLHTTGLAKDELADTGVRALASTAEVTAAIAESIARSGDPAVAVIPEGPYLIPVP